MLKLKHQNIIYERLRRQRLLNPIESSYNEQEYIELLKLLQPVAPVANTRPGDPPKLVHRTCFDDFELSGRTAADAHAQFGYNSTTNEPRF
jgi:hypothetical protein